MKDIAKLMASAGILAVLIVYAGLNDSGSQAIQKTLAPTISTATSAAAAKSATHTKSVKAERPKQQAAAQKKTVTKRFVVYFKFGSTKVSPRSQRSLQQALKFAKSVKAKHIGLSGFADRAGPAAYNLKLSKHRADTVAEVLKGVEADAKTVDVKAYGEQRLAVQTPDGKSHQRNRRVEIVITA